MAKIILKWRYLKPGTRNHNQNLVKYIAKRDGVRPPEVREEVGKLGKAGLQFDAFPLGKQVFQVQQLQVDGVDLRVGE